MQGKTMRAVRSSTENSRGVRPPGFTLIELLVVIAIISVLMALLLPAVQSVRESARRTECQNNLKQLGLALHNFHEVNNVFPASGWTTTGPGNPAGKFVGWRPLILPYVEQGNLQQVYDFNLNWWEGMNPATAGMHVKTFRCPSTPTRREVRTAVAKSPRPPIAFAKPIAPTDYEALMGIQPSSINPHLATATYTATNRHSVMYRNSQTRFRDIRDGTTQTIIVVECAARPMVVSRAVGGPVIVQRSGYRLG
jgi:prepilin-type N-terminal cleavage/methylation domain-containing protein